MRRRAELLAIGSELLDPWATDTNGSYLSLRLGERGIALRFRTVVGDRADDLEEAFRVALRRADLIVTTGGLGPTVDDITREAVSAALGLPLVEDAAIVRWIEERFRRHDRRMPPGNRRQALVPRGAEVLPNRLGTAPGLAIRAAGALIVLLPGVPAEMRQMVEDSVLPLLGGEGRRFVYRVLKVAGLGESDVDSRLAAIQRRAGDVAWTILARQGQIEIHLREQVDGEEPARGIERLDAEIERVLGTHLFGRDESTLEAEIGRLLGAAGQTLALAESLTGGAIARRVTMVPGASGYFRGGVVCYSDEAKSAIVGVRRETLAAHGAVSPEAAAEMAGGIRSVFGSSWGLATTGYAGPEGGGAECPPGTVFLAINGPGISRTVRRRLPGDRPAVQERCTQAALDLLRRALLEPAP